MRMVCMYGSVCLPVYLSTVYIMYVCMCVCVCVYVCMYVCMYKPSSSNNQINTLREDAGVRIVRPLLLKNKIYY